MKINGKKQGFDKAPIVLSRHEGYRQAVSRLEQLKKELSAHKTEVGRFELSLVRASSAARQASQRGFRVLRDLDEMEWNSTVQRIITAGMLTKDLLKAVRFEIPKPQLQDEYDAAILSSLTDERATVLLLERVIEVQIVEAQKQKQAAVREICASLKPERKPIVDNLMDGIVQLARAIEEEKTFGEWVAGSDPELLTGLRPRLFPTDLLSNAGLVEWLHQSIEAGMLTREQISALDLIPAPRLEAVSA